MAVGSILAAMRSPAPFLASAACAAFLFAVAPSVRVAGAASGEIALSWESCSPIVRDVTATSSPMSLFISVLGNDETHEAYQVRFVMGGADHTVPDAWRFDSEGCQPGALLSIEHLPSGALAKTCPAFQGNTTSSTQLEGFGFLGPSDVYGPGIMRGVLANIYSEGSTSTASQRYFLAEFRFDHIQSVSGEAVPGVTCGGLETPLCFSLLTGPQDPGVGTSAYYRLGDPTEIAFDGNSSTWVTVNGLGGCPAVPATPSTWGQIKSVYRR